jgi:hypothetical protein
MDGNEPALFYEPVLITPDGEGIFYQAGAFRTEAEAEAVLAIWRAEGRNEEMAINGVRLYSSVDEWRADR